VTSPYGVAKIINKVTKNYKKTLNKVRVSHLTQKYIGATRIFLWGVEIIPKPKALERSNQLFHIRDFRADNRTYPDEGF